MKLIDKLIEGKQKYISDKHSEPIGIVVRHAVKKIIDNMEFFSDHVVIRNRETILDGMRVYPSDYVEEGTAVYLDPDAFNWPLSANNI